MLKASSANSNPLPISDSMRLVDTRGAADVLQLNERTLENWRTYGRGPRYVKIGGRVRYRVSDLLSYLDESTRQSTGNHNPAAA